MHHITPLDPGSFDPRRLAPISHDFQHHPLLQLDALGDLARRLMPLQKCRFVKPGMRVDSSFDHFSVPPDGRDLEDVLRNIEEPGSWLALYDAQLDPVYREVLRDVAAHIERLVAPAQKVRDVRSFLFVSAPPSVTPFHIDRENNFWLQIRGRKTLTLWDHRDRSVVPVEAVERFILFGDMQDVRMAPDALERGRQFNCGPGDGVYFPSTTPHMTETHPDRNGGDTLSISVGMVFYTDVTSRDMKVMMLNHQLRRLGIRLREPGDSALRDSFKAVLGRSLWPLRRIILRKG